MLVMSPKVPPDVSGESGQDIAIVVSGMPMTARDRRVAVAVIAVLCLGMVVLVPFSVITPPRLTAIIPVLQTVICGFNLTTAFFLFSQYRLRPQRALLALAGGYLFSGLFAFLHSLAFPGAYAVDGLIGDGVNSVGWFFALWHVSFPLSIIAYAAWKAETVVNDPSPLHTIGIVVGVVLAAVAALAWLVVAGAGFLPVLFDDVTASTRFFRYQSGFILILSIIALACLYRRAQSLLSLWLMVAVLATLPDLALSAVLTSPRFTFGWYVARGYALIASATVLAVLLWEMTVLHARLANALALGNRERANRFMSLDVATGAITHEIRQPLTSIAQSAGAASLWLQHEPPNLDEVRSRLKAVAEAAHRADEILQSVRNLFRRSSDRIAAVYVEDVVEQVMRLMHYELHSNRVYVVTRYAEDRRPVQADDTQLQQVMLNLVKNAVDAMKPTPWSRRSICVSSQIVDNRVILLIEDTGIGIAAEARDKVLEPFFTTKETGTGLGLAVCRQIIEAHGGKLRLVYSDAAGTAFEIALPVAVVSAHY